MESILVTIRKLNIRFSEQHGGVPSTPAIFSASIFTIINQAVGIFFFLFLSRFFLFFPGKKKNQKKPPRPVSLCTLLSHLFFCSASALGLLRRRSTDNLAVRTQLNSLSSFSSSLLLLLLIFPSLLPSTFVALSHRKRHQKKHPPPPRSLGSHTHTLTRVTFPQFAIARACWG